MKKLFAVLVAVMALAIFSAPAFAALDAAPGPGASLEARVWLDFGYSGIDKDLYAASNGYPLKDDFTSFFTNINANSYLRGKFVSADKTTGALIELGIASARKDTEVVNLRYAYGWWKVGNCKLIVGQTDGLLGSLAFAPRQLLGTTEQTKILMIRWGFFYSGRHPQVRFDMTTKAGVFSIALVTPEAEQVESGPGVNQYYFPRVDLAWAIKLGGFLTIPGVSFSQIQYAEVNGLGVDDWDDKYNTWIVSLPFKYTAGAFTVKLTGFYGANIDSAFSEANNGATRNLLACQSLPTWKIDLTSGKGTVEDTLTWGGMFALEYAIGDATLTAGVGFVQDSNDGWKSYHYEGGEVVAPYQDDNNTRWAFFLAVPYQVTKNFDIQPEFGYYDYGDNPANGNSFGSEWLAGLAFRFIF